MCLPLSLSPSPAHAVSLCLSKINKKLKKKKKSVCEQELGELVLEGEISKPLFFLSLFILRERERERTQAGEGQRGRETEPQAGSALSAQM